MRIHVLSDLHNEFTRYRPDPVRADVVVLAGDVDLRLRGLEWAADVFASIPVVYVAGNHEYYGTALPHLTDKFRARAKVLGIHFLECEAVEIQGVRFLGTTLWTDLCLFGDATQGEQIAENWMMDYRKIRHSPSFRRLWPHDTTALHARSRHWLTQELQRGDVPTVVVTHHAPSTLGLAPGWEDEPVSVAYASRMDDFVARSGARLWIHGHTHRSVDARIGDVRLISNARGYVPDEPNPDFDPSFVVEI